MTRQALADLQDAKKRKKDWLEIVAILEEVRTSETWQETYENHSAWLTAAAESSGYSESILRRMLAASRFLEELKSEISDYERIVASGNGLPFSTIEILKRIHYVAPKKAVELFPLISRGEISHRQVLKEQSELTQLQRFETPFERDGTFSDVFGPAEPAKFVRRHRKRPDLEFSEEAVAVVHKHLHKFCGDEEAKFHFQRYQFEYAMTDAVAIKLDGLNVDWIDGFEFRYLPPHVLKRKRLNLIAEVALAASFFRKYWMIIPKLGELGEQLNEDFRRLGVANIGVIEIGDFAGREYRLHDQPEDAVDAPRQVSAAATVLSQGIPDLVAYA